MSVFQDADVQIVLADFANTDASGKLNIIGAGFSMMLPVPPAGFTAPFALAVTVNVPEKHVNRDYTLSIDLKDLTRDKLVQVPGLTGPEALRAQQVVTVSQIQVPPGLSRPKNATSQHIVAMSFPQGLQLQPGSYAWRVQIDTQTRPGWQRPFHFLGPDPGLIVGGPAGPETIQGVEEYIVPMPESDSGSTEEK